MENLLKTARSSMSGHEQAKPEETFETQKTFTSLGSHLSGELLQDFWSQKFLERFEWKMSMEKGRFIFVVHCKTSLGLGFVTLSNDSRRFFALVLYLHRVISKLHGIGRPSLDRTNRRCWKRILFAPEFRMSFYGKVINFHLFLTLARGGGICYNTQS